jgi:hypothetical protein
MTRNEEVVHYAIERIHHGFSEDIDLLLCYGSYVNGTADEDSDVDMYFIPRNEKGEGLGETFILNGIGYDMFGMSWERVQGIADFKESLSPLVGDVKILYSRSDHETDRFKQLQQLMQTHLRDARYMHDRACERVEKAVAIHCDRIPASSIGRIRMGAGRILMLLAEAVAYMNQTYFHRGLKTQYADLMELKRQPLEFTSLYHDVITENEAEGIMDKCEKIIRNTIDFLEMDQESTFLQTTVNPCAEGVGPTDPKIDMALDYDGFARWYEELSSTFNKVYRYAERKDHIRAFISACCLQYSLESDLGVPLVPTDLLGDFRYDDLGKLATVTREIERNCIAEIERNHATIRRVGSVDELKGMCGSWKGRSE